MKLFIFSVIYGQTGLAGLVLLVLLTLEKPSPLVWAANKKGGHVATARRSGFIIFSILVNLFD